MNLENLALIVKIQSNKMLSLECSINVPGLSVQTYHKTSRGITHRICIKIQGFVISSFGFASSA